jgi:hypothetical protein
MGSSVNNLSNHLSNLNVGNDERKNITIGSKIKLYNNDVIYLFYGYNFDKSIVCCFPIDSNNVIENIKYVPITEIDKIL